MAHHHHDDETYFLDQICMVALSGAFGVICLCMYFLQKGMLYRLLGTQFHPFVLASGITLVVIAVVRSGMLWSMAGAKMTLKEHDHDHTPEPGHGGHEHSHGHEHAHSHGDGGHDHAHSHAVLAESRAFGHMPAPAPVSSHSHEHGHEHGEGHADHDHGWAPWRYVVLLMPIILFMLGLPSKGPSIVIEGAPLDTTRDALEEAQFHITLAAIAIDRTAPIGVLLARAAADTLAGEVEFVNVKRLEDLASSSTDRDYYKGKTIKVRGVYAPRSDRYFELVRFRIQCCAGDAVQVSVPVLAKESVVISGTQPWVEVTGKVDFRADAKGAFKTVVLVAQQKQVQKCNPDLNPYLQ